jgi:hypothetical protein
MVRLPHWHHGAALMGAKSRNLWAYETPNRRPKYGTFNPLALRSNPETCQACGREVAVGSWPFCPHGQVSEEQSR